MGKIPKFLAEFYDGYLSNWFIILAIITIGIIAIRIINQFIAQIADRFRIHIQTEILIREVVALFMVFAMSFFTLVAAFNFQVNPWFFMPALLSVFIYLGRGYIFDAWAGIFCRVLGYCRKGDLIELHDRKGVVVKIGLLKVDVLISPNKVMQLPNSIFKKEFTRNYSRETEKQLAFDVNVPTALNLDEAKTKLGIIMNNDICVNRYQVSDTIKSIKPGYSFNMKIKVWYFDGCYWHIVNKLHNQIMGTFKAEDNSETVDAGILYFENEASGTE